MELPQYLENIYVAAGRIRDSADLTNSSSGGAFTALSNLFIKNGSVVACSGYDYKLHCQKFKIVETIAERNQARGSKYIQADSSSIYHDVEDWIKNNQDKILMFIGLGCQADAMHRYAELKGFRDKIFIVDIICHGVASPAVWKEYVCSKEAKAGKIHFLNFKDKRKGWEHPTAVAKSESGEIDLFDFVTMFYSGDILRPSCHKCPYATEKRTSDITIGDYWGIKDKIPTFYNAMGTSLFLIHSQEGKKVFDNISADLDWVPSNLRDCMQPNLQYPTKKNLDRESYWRDYHKYGIDYVTKKYGNPNICQRFARKIKKIQKKYYSRFVLER